MTDENTIDLGAQKQRMLEEFDRLHALIVQQADEIKDLIVQIKEYDIKLTNANNVIEALKRQMAADFETIQTQKIQLKLAHRGLDNT